MTVSTQTTSTSRTSFYLSCLACVDSGVTVALNLLENSALISINRGVVTIVDRKGLKAAANGAYGVSEAEFNRVFG